MNVIFQCFLLGVTLLEPPIAEKIPKSEERFGKTLTDNYFWLRDESNPKVTAYLESENAYTAEQTKDLAGIESTLYEEMKNRSPQDDTTVPVKRGEYYYYRRWEEGKAYPLYARKKGSLDSSEEIIFDENLYAEGAPCFSLGSLDLSDDQNLLAYSLDIVGNEIYTLKFKDLSKNQELKDVIYPVSGGAEFAADNTTVFYLVSDEALRVYRLYRHKLGEDSKEDVLIFEEKDPLFSLALYKSKDKKYLFLRSANNTTSTTYFLSADHPEGTFEQMLPKKEGVKYSVEHHGDQFLLLINDTSLNYRVLVYPTLTELIPARDEVTLDRMEIFQDFLALFERSSGLQQIEVVDMKTQEREIIPFQEPTYSLSDGTNPEFTSTLLRFGYSSLITPETVFDWDMQKHRIELKKQKVVHHFNRSDYVLERIFATSHDGTQIPISLVYKKEGPKSGWLLTGYGAYGISYPVSFSVDHLSLLDRGIGFAIAHIRGGGEYGRRWYDEGRMMKKKNTFYDFIAAAEHLIAKKYTTKDKLVIEGGSAGGLLMGAVTNMRPDLFRAVIAKVPFVDLINTMSDPTLPATIGEYQEWGNPEIKEQFLYMLSYSPYDNVSDQKYPDMLITAGLHDPRVSYWEPAKWTARLRATKKGDNPVYLKTNMKAGHFGASGRYDSLREQAFIFAYIFNLFNLN